RLKALQPDNPFPLNLEGTAQLGRGEFTAARAAFERALKLDPNFAPAGLNLAELDLREGNVEAARERYLALTENKRADTRAMVALARIAIAAERNDEAIEWLEKVQKIDPASIGAQLMLAELQLRERRLEAAIQTLDTAEARHPRNLE